MGSPGSAGGRCSRKLVRGHWRHHLALRRTHPTRFLPAGAYTAVPLLPPSARSTWHEIKIAAAQVDIGNTNPVIVVERRPNSHAGNGVICRCNTKRAMLHARDYPSTEALIADCTFRWLPPSPGWRVWMQAVGGPGKLIKPSYQKHVQRYTILKTRGEPTSLVCQLCLLLWCCHATNRLGHSPFYLFPVNSPIQFSVIGDVDQNNTRGD